MEDPRLCELGIWGTYRLLVNYTQVCPLRGTPAHVYLFSRRSCVTNFALLLFIQPTKVELLLYYQHFTKGNVILPSSYQYHHFRMPTYSAIDSSRYCKVSSSLRTGLTLSCHFRMRPQSTTQETLPTGMIRSQT